MRFPRESAFLASTALMTLVGCGGGNTPKSFPNPAPTLTAMTPGTGPVGTSVVLTGTAFTGATAVSFGGTAAAFTLNSATQITTSVPAGAATGTVSVTAPLGTAVSSSPFTVTIPAQGLPTITGFAPAAGYTGQTITLLGTSFTSTTAVTFGGKAALFRILSDTQLQATPPSDAATGVITVTNAQGPASSASAFTIQPVVADLVLAGGFENSGGGNWSTLAATPTYREITASAHGGDWYVILLGNGPNLTDEMTQELDLPASTEPATLTFWTRITANATSAASDTLAVEVRDTQGVLLKTVATFTAADASTGWVKRTADLSTYKGRRIRLAFKATETAMAGTSFRLDDVSLPMTLPGVSGTPFDVSLTAAYVVQSTQRTDSAVPLVAGRNAWVRVFAVANQPNAAQPQVRALFKQGAATVGTLALTATATGLPTTMNEGIAALSYQGQVPSAWLQPGVTLEATVDPGLTMLESTTGNNTITHALDVRTVPDYKITLFAISSPSGTGAVTASNLDAWLDRFRKLYPVQAIDAQFGGTFVTSENLETGASGTTGGNTSWGACLSQLEAKRQTDGNGPYRTYFGGLKVAYTSGTAGLAYLATSAAATTGRAGLGWDKTGYADGGNFPEVLAHELGHTLGRSHSPCGDPATVDAAYPYAQADIGVYGLDPDTGVIKSPKGQTDIMGYCSPVWISDYVFQKVLAFRGATTAALGLVPASAVPASLPAPAGTLGATTPCLLVMGVMSGEELELQPAFTLDSHPALPEPGPYTLEGLSASGQVLVSQPFAMHDLADGQDPQQLQNFVFTLPLAADKAAALVTLRVRKGSAVLAGRSRTAASLDALAKGEPLREPQATRLSDGSVYLSWDAARHPLVMLRDAVTGAVLGFAKEGDSRLKPQQGELELVLSDGVGSPRVRTRIRE